MKKEMTVTEAARNFADCVNRAHYQNATFVLIKNGMPVARLVPDIGKTCSGRDLASALSSANLVGTEAEAWNHDLRDARKNLRPLPDKWR